MAHIWVAHLRDGLIVAKVGSTLPKAQVKRSETPELPSRTLATADGPTHLRPITRQLSSVGGPITTNAGAPFMTVSSS